MNVPPRRQARPFMIMLIILGAVALRLYRLDQQSLWYDEGVTAYLGQQGVVGLTTWTAHDIQPPLYYYTIAGGCGSGLE
ncbi:MAG: hypothetical protein R2867_08735 [Caldilineaceae bacterium]